MDAAVELADRSSDLPFARLEGEAQLGGETHAPPLLTARATTDQTKKLRVVGLCIGILVAGLALTGIEVAPTHDPQLPAVNATNTTDATVRSRGSVSREWAEPPRQHAVRWPSLRPGNTLHR